MNAFRYKLRDYEPVPGDYLKFPHDVSKLKLKSDGSCVVTHVLEDGKPLVDPLLDSSWTNVDEMLKNNSKLNPITQYIDSSIESRMSLLKSTLSNIDSSRVTPEPTSEPTSEPTLEV